MIALPLRGRTGTQGVIEILNPRAEMSDYSIAFLHILADHAAIAIENARDVSRIQQLTITDDTTGLYNVRHLYDVLGRELKRSKKHKLPLSLAFWDLDHFKLVNDAHGHMVGSELLTLVGARLQKLSRERDLCFRYGGDEFAILTPGSDAARAMQHAERIRRRLELFRPDVVTTGEPLVLTASVGVAIAEPGMSRVDLITRADQALYQAKADGRNCVRLAEGAR